MTPLRKPRPALIKARHNIQLTATQRAMRNRPRPAPMTTTQDEIDKAIAKVTGRPHAGQTIEALPGTPPTDEADAGFYAALLLRPAKVGRGPGDVPSAVSDRLYDAGLVRRCDAPSKAPGL